MSEPASPSRQLTVQLPDQTEASYLLRGLTESEISNWAAFCASVFSYKANPPPSSYFERHYYNDPQREPSYVRVALFGDEIVSSCRIFVRTISNGSSGGTLHAGGIGEVCTHHRHRRRGLSKELLLDAINIMTGAGIQVSVLHAAPAFFPVYQSVGYACSTTRWTVVKVDASNLGVDKPVDSCYSVRLACFPQDTDDLIMIHQRFSENAFAGCIIRSREYWEEYVSRELKDTIWICEGEGADHNVLGWMSVCPRGDRIQIRDFGCRNCKRLGYSVFSLLLREATKDVGQASFSISAPSVVLELIQGSNETNLQGEAQGINWYECVSENDLGWMYKPLGDEGFNMADVDTPHLIWPADSF